MADKWQIWYPHKIDAWQGSATIQTFSDGAYRGYHNLIMAQFQAEDGMLPDDDRALAKESRLGPRWPEYAAEIRAHLETDVPGRIYSATQYALWQEAHGKHVEYLERMESARLAKEAKRLAQLNAQSNTQDNAQLNAQLNANPVDSSTHNPDSDSDSDSKKKIKAKAPVRVNKNPHRIPGAPISAKPSRTHSPWPTEYRLPGMERGGQPCAVSESQPVGHPGHWLRILYNRSQSPINQKASLSTWVSRCLRGRMGRG